MQNGYVESFDGKFRDECLNERWFQILAQARSRVVAYGYSGVITSHARRGDLVDSLTVVVFVVLLAATTYQMLKQFRLAKERSRLLEEARQELDRAENELQSTKAAAKSIEQSLVREVASLSRFKEVRDVAAESQRLQREAQAAANEIRAEADKHNAEAQSEADRLRQAAIIESRARREELERVTQLANTQAASIIEQARKRAEEIGGDAYRALQEASRMAAAVTAMKNVIEGYGDRYMIPTHSLLDELAEAYSHSEAGVELKKARQRSRQLAESGGAADCNYAEHNRRQTAIRFVIDAFNGKADSILSRAKVDNFGTLQQGIRDAAALVTNNGAAFRNARILPEYVDARIEELKWAVRATELREQEREEQRRIRERIREEERARKEIERALKEAAKEEDLIRKAMERAQAQIAKASEDQRQQFEIQLEELQGRLAAAEEKNQRALSMAQQTKAGHVYVISNVGSFGEHVYKVGMTRRVEPLDRIRELGDASVPFAFDVQAMIWSENAPQLETLLHRQFLQMQVNKVNPRKEFFRIGIAQIRDAVEKMQLNANWSMTADAREYRESLAIAQQIQTDAGAREAWTRQQMAFEAAMLEEGDADEEARGPALLPERQAILGSLHATEAAAK